MWCLQLFQTLGPNRMKTQLDPGELEGKIFGWMGEGRENLNMRKEPEGEPSGSACSEKPRKVGGSLQVRETRKEDRYVGPPGWKLLELRPQSPRKPGVRRLLYPDLHVISLAQLTFLDVLTNTHHSGPRLLSSESGLGYKPLKKPTTFLIANPKL